MKTLFAMFCTILMYGKNLFSEIWAKMLSVSQSDCKIFKSNISSEQIDELAKFVVACL